MAPPAKYEPIAYRIDDACRVLGVGRTRLYHLIGAGLLDARKTGARTLITAESLRRYVETLPIADIHTGQGAKVP